MGKDIDDDEKGKTAAEKHGGGFLGELAAQILGTESDPEDEEEE